jgi:hypothetical protein
LGVVADWPDQCGDTETLTSKSVGRSRCCAPPQSQSRPAFLPLICLSHRHRAHRLISGRHFVLQLGFRRLAQYLGHLSEALLFGGDDCQVHSVAPLLVSC